MCCLLNVFLWCWIIFQLKRILAPNLHFYAQRYWKNSPTKEFFFFLLFRAFLYTYPMKLHQHLLSIHEIEYCGYKNSGFSGSSEFSDPQSPCLVAEQYYLSNYAFSEDSSSSGYLLPSTFLDGVHFSVKLCMVSFCEELPLMQTVQ